MPQADHPPPTLAQRILIAGVTGVGKTTLASRISAASGIPHTEIDALHHGPDWSVRDSFVADVKAFSATPQWVTEWQYPEVRGLLADRADTLIWLDLPRRVALPRLLRRTIRRSLLREELWNGNVEPPLHTFFTDPSDNIIRWEMKTHNNYRTLVPVAAQEYPHLNVIRLRSSGDVRGWLGGWVAGG